MTLDSINAEIGKRVRSRRREIGITQAVLAQSLAVTFQQVHKYERGQSAISAAQLSAIASALCAPIDYFYDSLAPEPDEA